MANLLPSSSREQRMVVLVQAMVGGMQSLLDRRNLGIHLFRHDEAMALGAMAQQYCNAVALHTQSGGDHARAAGTGMAVREGRRWGLRPDVADEIATLVDLSYQLTDSTMQEGAVHAGQG